MTTRKSILATAMLTLLATPAMAAAAPKGTCLGFVDRGWSNSLDVSEYVLTKPGADKLGLGSPCNIDSLVFSQCWLEPRLTVKQAIDLLLAKARAGKKLPDTPICGA
jgi:hypothetical protein